MRLPILGPAVIREADISLAPSWQCGDLAFPSSCDPRLGMITCDSTCCYALDEICVNGQCQSW
jgi:hypothetical protein